MIKNKKTTLRDIEKRTRQQQKPVFDRKMHVCYAFMTGKRDFSLFIYIPSLLEYFDRGFVIIATANQQNKRLLIRSGALFLNKYTSTYQHENTH